MANLTMGFISTDPEYKKQTKCQCEKCGRVFMKPPYSNAFSKTNKNIHYKFEKNTYESQFSVVLCDSCAEEELAAKNVGLLLH